jgi:hypothetical protein
LSPADENGKCPDGVTPQSLFQWEEAKWIGGTMAYTNWTKREPVQANLIANTIDFPSLQLNVSYSSALSLKIFLQNQALCSMSAAIQNGLSAVSCACDFVTFNGRWDVDLTNGIQSNDNLNASALATTCFDESCLDVSSGFLASKTSVLNGTEVSLNTFKATLTFAVNASSVDVTVSVVPGRVYSRPTTSPLALSFLETNYNLNENNPFGVVTNKDGVIVGQIQSDMIRIQVDDTSGENVNVTMLACILLDPSIGVNDVRYDIFDMGILLADGITTQPMGLTNELNVSGTGSPKICFSEISLIENVTSVILIKRDADYETATAYTSGEKSILLTSGALFCFGGVLVVFFHCVIPFHRATFFAGMQGVALLLFRGVYFFVLASGDIVIGGLLDFALIEIPTFIYIGIFLRIIIMGYWVFFKFQEMSQTSLYVAVFIALLLNWLVFAVLMIAVAFSDNSSNITKSCNCQLSGEVQQSDTSRIIRLVYKSFVFVVAIIVFILTVVFGKKLVKERNPKVYYQVVGLSLGLLLDCLAFLIYYAINTPTAYFAVVLWFTELLPIAVVNGMVAEKPLRFWFSLNLRSFSSSSSQELRPRSR